MKKTQLFVVKEEGYDEIHAIFSSREKAEAYMQRFPDIGGENCSIEVQELDPEFVSLSDKSPYEVKFTGNKDDDYHVSASPYLYEEARDQRIFWIAGTTAEVFVLASNEGDAGRKALEIRQELIQKGKWKPSSHD
jgi:hypothetical protein